MRSHIIAACLFLASCNPLGPGTSSDTAQSSTSQSRAAPGDHVPIGDDAHGQTLDLVFQPALVKSRVGEAPYLSEDASECGVLVVVRYSIKNVSMKPVKVYDMPKVHLVDPSGTPYESDAGKTGAYTMQAKVDQKLWSDLNPGITVQNAEVFEVSKDTFDPKTWSAVVEGHEQLIALAAPAG